MHHLTKKIILASQSPRRKQLMETMGFQFEIKTKPIDEVFPSDLEAKEVAGYLAELKAKAFEHEIDEEEVIITSDTVVVASGQVLGKPVNKDEAYSMLKSMSDSSHEVYTSVCFYQKDQVKTMTDCTIVNFLPISDEEIHFYIHESQPFDKAGSYGIQDWIGLTKIKSIEGSYYNVMGFPTHLVYEYLTRYMTK